MIDEMNLTSTQIPFEYTLSIISGKWKLQIICLLAGMETVRYGILKKSIAGITNKMLTSQLKVLENENIVIRKEYPQIPPKVEYSLSQKGKSLIPLMQDICDWGEAHSD